MVVVLLSVGITYYRTIVLQDFPVIESEPAEEEGLEGEENLEGGEFEEELDSAEALPELELGAALEEDLPLAE